MKYSKTNRRMFLQGAGQLALAIPFLPSLFPSEAKAASVPLPKYIHINSSWALPRAHATPLYQMPFPPYPQPSGTTPNSVPWIQKDAVTKYQSLQEIIKYQGKISWALDEKWNPFANQLNLVTNAHAYVSDNRFNSSVCSTAASGNGLVAYPNANGPTQDYCYSVDWLVEQALYRSSGVPAIPTLRIHNLKTEGENCFLGFCYATINGVEQRLPMLNGLAEIKAKFLGAFSGAGQAVPPSTRKIRIDSVLEDFKRVLGHRRVSATDRQRLSDAADLWRDIEKRADQNACSSTQFSNIDTSPTNWRLIHEASMDAVVAALACGLTRNVSYGLIHGGDNIQDIPGVGDSRQPGQDFSITDPYYDTIRWRSDLVTRFLGKLAALKDENGQTLLNSSLAVWAHTTSSNSHGMFGHALVSVGSAGGKLETGWHVDAGAAPINRFHLTNMKALGLTTADIERNGKPGFGEYSPTTAASAGGLVELEKDMKYDISREYNTSQRAYFFQDSEKRKPFPYLKP